MAKHFTLPYEGGLITENLPAGILHTYEKIWTHVYPESRPASYVIADYIVESINARKEGLYRLGLTTGATPVSLYNELARRYQLLPLRPRRRRLRPHRLRQRRAHLQRSQLPNFHGSPNGSGQRQ